MPKRKRQDGEEGSSSGGGLSTPLAEGRPKRRRNDTTLVSVCVCGVCVC